MTVERRNGKFVLVSRTGKVLGRHDTRSAAERQEKKIQIEKARAAGHRIPRK